MGNKVLFIIGAGASHDSATDKVTVVAERKLQPPLTNQLFSDIGRTYYDVRQSVPELSGLFGNINQAMQEPTANLEEFIKDIRPTIGESREQKLRWYLAAITAQMTHRYIQDSSNYDILLDHVIANGVDAAFVSFNYDGLLELAISKAVRGINYGALGDYLMSPKVFKPHGSFCWFFDESECLQTDGLGIRLHPASSVNRRCAIMTPEAGKRDFIYPQDHHEALVDLMGNVDQIITVGWKGQDEDFFKEIVSKLNRRKVIITTVSSTQRTEDLLYSKISRHCEARRLNYRKILGLDETSLGGFSEFVRMNPRQFKDFFAVI